MMFSMVAEIGGYSGLLIGFSLMDIALLFQYFIDKLSEMKPYGRHTANHALDHVWVGTLY